MLAIDHNHRQRLNLRLGGGRRASVRVAQLIYELQQEKEARKREVKSIKSRHSKQKHTVVVETYCCDNDGAVVVEEVVVLSAEQVNEARRAAQLQSKWWTSTHTHTHTHNCTH